MQLINEAVHQKFVVLFVTLSDPETISEVVREAALFGLTAYLTDVGAELAACLDITGFRADASLLCGAVVGKRQFAVWDQPTVQEVCAVN